MNSVRGQHIIFKGVTLPFTRKLKPLPNTVLDKKWYSNYLIINQSKLCFRCSENDILFQIFDDDWEFEYLTKSQFSLYVFFHFCPVVQLFTPVTILQCKLEKSIKQHLVKNYSPENIFW